MAYSLPLSEPMPVTIKTPEEIEKMRIAGKLAADVLEMITPHVQAGISTLELDTIVTTTWSMCNTLFPPV